MALDYNDLAVGDVVQLMSGGPFMTVKGKAGPDKITVVWMVTDGSDTNEKTLHSDLLRKVGT